MVIKKNIIFVLKTKRSRLANLVFISSSLWVSNAIIFYVYLNNKTDYNYSSTTFGTIIFFLYVTDPCKEVNCGENALCFYTPATERAFCACPDLMIGDPYDRCGTSVYIRFYNRSLTLSFHP